MGAVESAVPSEAIGDLKVEVSCVAWTAGI